jgi:hypothetical protein
MTIDHLLGLADQALPVRPAANPVLQFFCGYWGPQAITFDDERSRRKSALTELLACENCFAFLHESSWSFDGVL